MNNKKPNNQQEGNPVLIKAFRFFNEPEPAKGVYTAPNSHSTSDVTLNNPDAPTALNAEYQFLKQHSVYTYGGSLYVSNGSCYERKDRLEVAGMIADACPEFLSQVPSRRIFNSAAEGLFSNNALRLADISQSETLVPFQNCYIDTCSMQFVCPEQGYFLSYRLNANYVESYSCPQFDAFLYYAMNGDPYLINRVWQTVGYLLTMDNRGKKIFLLQGKPNTGKSLLCNLIQSFYPYAMQSHVNIHALGRQFTPAELEGKALCVSSDMTASPLSEDAAGELKRLSGNDTIDADVKFRQARTIRNQARFLLATNHPFLLKHNDPALMQRIVVIPFLRQIEPSMLDPDLYGKIDAERDVIASRAIRTYLCMLHSGLYPYAFSGQYEVNAGLFEKQCDPAMLEQYTREFIARHIRPATDGCVRISDAHAAFCEEYGEIYINSFSSCFRQEVAVRFSTSEGRVQNSRVLIGVMLV